MTPLDVLILLAAVVAGIFGYRRGGIVGLTMFIGLAGGTLLGIGVALAVVSSWEPGRGQTITAVIIVAVIATVAQALCHLGGVRLRQKLPDSSRRTDSALGALVGSASLLVVAFGSATVAQNLPVPGLATAVAESTVVGTVHRVVPEPATQLLLSFGELFTTAIIPRIVPRDPDPLPGIKTPPRALLEDPEIRKARGSIVSVLGEADSCNKRVTGSGVVYAPGRVLTNAHVVAGVRRGTVRIGGTGRAYPATVVAFDSARDVAVLAVPGLPAPALPLADTNLRRNDGAVLAGFPGGGRYVEVPARVRESLTLRGPDIYGKRTVARKVVVLHARIAPGTSGGPLLLPDGTVGGLIFAKSAENADTAYVLQPEEVTPLARSSEGKTARVDTGPCVD